jgi:hypothetical protein
LVQVGGVVCVESGSGFWVVRGLRALCTKEESRWVAMRWRGVAKRLVVHMGAPLIDERLLEAVHRRVLVDGDALGAVRERGNVDLEHECVDWMACMGKRVGKVMLGECGFRVWYMGDSQGV